MIVTQEQECYRLITQNDHANWAYQLLKLWPQLRTHPRREVIIEATRLHDRGWHGVDASPLVTPDGQPHDFLSLPTEHREAVWRRAIMSEATQPGDPDLDRTQSVALQWRELLICHHAWIIHHPQGRLSNRSQRRLKALLPLASALAAERTARIEHLRDRLEQEENRLALTSETLESALVADYTWLGTLDFLSLIACSNWHETFELPMPATEREANAGPANAQIAARGGAWQLTLSPYPLAGRYTLSVRCRDIPIRAYNSNSDLSLELARATWQKLDIQVSGAQE